MLSLLLSKYQGLHMPGTYHENLDHSTLTPAPLPDGETRGAWKWKTTPPGPVGLLVDNTHMLGGSLQLPQVIFRSDTGADINLLTEPYNHLILALQGFAFQAIQYQASCTRTVLQDCPRIDKHIYRSSVAVLPVGIQGAVYVVATLSIADQGYIHTLDQEQTDECPFYQKCTSSVPHICFDCEHPKLVEARLHVSDDPKLPYYERHILENINVLPEYLKHGIPPPMALMPDTPWWTNEMPNSIVSTTSRC